MRGRIPDKKDLQRTLLGILQSTAFLTTSAVSYSTYICIIRHLFGGFNLYTASYVPAFMSSITAIVIERPSRRNLLCLYVANVATESLWRMAVDRGLVKGIRRGQVIIFGISASFLVYYFRRGLHLEKKDSVYDVLRFIVGKDEEGGEKTKAQERERKRKLLSNFVIIQQFLKIFTHIQTFLKSFSKHEKCPHSHSCVYYCTSGGTKLFAIGLGIQATLKLVLQIPKIVKTPKKVMRSVFSRDTLRIGMFLGGFSAIYRVN
jgi:hypothetical protein